jgi:anthranilate phosphoribosyltransferase
MSHELVRRIVAGEPVTRAQAADLLRDFAEDQVSPVQLAAVLTALSIRGESPSILIGFVEVLRERLIPVEIDGLDAVDLCGTGGDGQSLVNLSTAAAFVVAGAGVPVAKHGNHGVSSRTGSADVLQALGLPLALKPEAISRCIRENGLGFIYAPAHHPLFAKIGPVRRQLGFRTAFNMLGPLCNPARVKRQLIGTFNLEAMRTVAEVLAVLGVERALVVHTPGPYDEVSLTTAARCLRVEAGRITEEELSPEAFGVSAVDPKELIGGDADHNARCIEAVLQGEPGAVRQAVCANAACALLAAGVVGDVREGFIRAEQAIDSGAAMAKLYELRRFTKEEANELAQ